VAAKAASSSLEPGRNCWRVARAHRAALIVDGCDYFRLVRQAMLKAREGRSCWSAGTSTPGSPLDEPGGKGDPPNCHLGPLLSWLVGHRPGAPKIHILAWGGMAYKRARARGTTLARMGGVAGQPPDPLPARLAPIRAQAAIIRRSP
jgi:phospholipase D1/2